MRGRLAGGRLAGLAFDLAALVLLVLAMAYWWLGNLAHEAFGTAMFLILGRHLAVNRRWFGAIRRGRYDTARRLRLALNLSLAFAMAVLLLTSLAISQSLFAVLPIGDYLSLREVHWFAGYWVLIIVGLHIGLHWHIVANILRSRWPGLMRRPLIILFRLCAAVIAVMGIGSTLTLGIWPRLRFDYSMVMWDFTTDAVPFFGHWLAIVTLSAVAAQVILRLTARLKPAARS